MIQEIYTFYKTSIDDVKSDKKESDELLLIGGSSRISKILEIV